MYHQLLLKCELSPAMRKFQQFQTARYNLTICMIMINNQNIPYQYNVIQHNTLSK